MPTKEEMDVMHQLNLPLCKSEAEIIIGKILQETEGVFTRMFLCNLFFKIYDMNQKEYEFLRRIL